ncbi:acyl-CoA dehydrogenase family protein [Chloroflexota bacterium]
MDYRFTEEQERLRKELRDFYINELSENYAPEASPSHSTPAGVNEESRSFWMALQKKAGAKGYLTPGWPKEYGGLGFTSIEQGIVQEEEALLGLAWPNFIGYHLAGPATLLFGTEEQKKEFIPPMTRGDVIWMEAFTEPDAGSDEANMQCRAVEDGDDYVLNGQKIFISGGFKPDYLYTEARTLATMPKHRGLSLFLIPADTPGITYRPIQCMGFGLQNEIFFDDVRVPKRYMLGELNRGFYHAMATFEFERSGTGLPARARRCLQDFVQFCKEEKRNGKPLIKDPEVRKALAQMAVEMEVWRLIAWHTQWWFGQREKLGPKPYDLTGFFTKMFDTRHAEVMMNVLGIYGQLKAGSKRAKLTGRIENSWQVARSLHAAGTFEINKVVLAQRGLGLPRPPRPVTTKTEDKQ